MKNVTLAIDDKVLEEARAYARAKGTTLNGLVRQYLSGLVKGEKQIEEARRGILELIDNSTARMGPGYKWNRQELYEDAGGMLPRHQHPRVRSGNKKG